MSLTDIHVTVTVTYLVGGGNDDNHDAVILVVSTFYIQQVWCLGKEVLKLFKDTTDVAQCSAEYLAKYWRCITVNVKLNTLLLQLDSKSIQLQIKVSFYYEAFTGNTMYSVHWS